MPNQKWELYKNHETGILFDLTDADAQGKLTAILDGTTIDSFADVESALADKVDVVVGKGLSTNDYIDADKAKVAGAFPRSEQAVLGAKNFLPNNAVSGSDNNTTWVVNADKSVTINTGTGGASANVVVDVIRPITIKKGSYKLSGCPSGGSQGTYYLQLRKADGTQYDIRDTGSGYDLTLSEDTTFTYCAIVLLSGTEANNLVFKPMLRLSTDTDSTYAPYAMTNRELTEKVAENRVLKVLGGTAQTATVTMKTAYAPILVYTNNPIHAEIIAPISTSNVNHQTLGGSGVITDITAISTTSISFKVPAYTAVSILSADGISVSWANVS